MREANIERTARARRLRREPTNAELKLWYRLRARTLDGCKFVRQEPIGPYTVDFVCRERRLVIEVMAGSTRPTFADKVRDQWLTDHQYRMLRFWNNDVLGNIEGVLEMISVALSAARPPHPDGRS